MKVFLHSDNAERARSYMVTVSPAADHGNVRGEVPKEWLERDGSPRQIQIDFSFGSAEVPDALAVYLVERGIAHKSRLLRKIQKLFNRHGHPINEVFDEHGERIFLDNVPA